MHNVLSEMDQTSLPKLQNSSSIIVDEVNLLIDAQAFLAMALISLVPMCEPGVRLQIAFKMSHGTQPTASSIQVDQL